MASTATATMQQSQQLKPFLTEDDLAELLGVSRQTIRRMHADGRLPRGRRITDRVVRWSADTIRKWFEKCPPA
jgi:excisionase family DNA binding protein